MMKKTAVVVALSLAPFATAFADNDVGCGLGTMAFKGQSGVFFKVLAATTNGSFGNQTFGITSGTLGCSSDGVIAAKDRLPVFASANMDQLAQDMAAGQGEALAALASLYQVSAADRGAFYTLAKQNYSSIFANDQVTSTQMLQSLESAMRADARLSHYAS